MPKLTHIEHKGVIGMLQAYMDASVITQQFRCHVRTIERLRNRFRQTGTTSDRPRPDVPVLQRDVELVTPRQ